MIILVIVSIKITLYGPYGVKLFERKHSPLMYNSTRHAVEYFALLNKAMAVEECDASKA